jgi:integrase
MLRKRLRPPRFVKREIQPLTRAQMRSLLEAAKDEKLHGLYVLAVTTGMRQGELLGLQWKDIDFDAGTLRVNRSVYNGKVSPPKTNSGRRTIRLSKLAIRALKTHRVNTAKLRISEWVFSTGKGTPISNHNLHNRSWKPLLKRAGLPHSTRFHDLRHSCISLLLSQGVAIKVVSEMAGHADVSITLSVYGHVLPDMQSTAADGIDKALG